MIHRKWSLLTGPVAILGGIVGSIVVANFIFVQNVSSLCNFIFFFLNFFFYLFYVLFGFVNHPRAVALLVFVRLLFTLVEWLLKLFRR